jgi:hypothetical protein
MLKSMLAQPGLSCIKLNNQGARKILAHSEKRRFVVPASNS